MPDRWKMTKEQEQTLNDFKPEPTDIHREARGGWLTRSKKAYTEEDVVARRALKEEL